VKSSLFPYLIVLGLLAGCGSSDNKTDSSRRSDPVPTEQSPAPTPAKDPQLVPAPEPVPAPTPAPEPVPAPTPAPEPVPAPTPAPEPVPAPTPAPEPVPAPIPAPEPVPAPTPAPEPVPAPTPAPEPVPAPTPAPEPVPAPTPAPEPVPAPTPAPEPVPAPTPVPEPAPAPALPTLVIQSTTGSSEGILGTPFLLTVQATYSDGTQTEISSVEWELKEPNTARATIDANGHLRASNPGSVSVLASALGTSSQPFTVTFVEPSPTPAPTLTGITLTADSLEPRVGDTTKLIAKATWSDGSSRPITQGLSWTITPAGERIRISATNEAFSLEALVAGELQVRAELAGVSSNTLRLLIQESAPPPQNLEIRLNAGQDQSLQVNEELNATAVLVSGAATSPAGDVQWSVVEGTGRASLLAAGRVRALAPGSFTLQAQLGTLTASLSFTIEAPAFAVEQEFWVYAGEPDGTKFPWYTEDTSGFIFTTDAAEVSEGARACAMQAQESLQRFRDTHKELLAELETLGSTGSASTFRIVVNVVQGRYLRQLRNLDRGPYFWHWNKTPGQTPTLALSRFQGGEWIWEVASTQDGLQCRQPSDSEGKRYLEYAKQRLTVRDQYIVPATTPR
jgi:hypothetical protein